MRGSESAVETPALVVQPRGVGAGAQAQPLAERQLVLPARPHGNPYPRPRERFGVAAEGQASEGGVDPDDFGVGGAVDVAVWGDGNAEISCPALARAHGGQIAPDIRRHRRRRLPCQHLLEMPARQRVFLLEEERAREFEPHAHQFGPVDENGAKGGDGLVEQRRALVFGKAFAFGGRDRRHAGLEQDGRAVAALAGQGARRLRRRPGRARGDRRLVIRRHRGQGEKEERGAREQGAQSRVYRHILNGFPRREKLPGKRLRRGAPGRAALSRMEFANRAARKRSPGSNASGGPRWRRRRTCGAGCGCADYCRSAPNAPSMCNAFRSCGVFSSPLGAPSSLAAAVVNAPNVPAT